MAAEAGPSAGALAGALSDDNRRSVFAAVQLGANRVDDVVATTCLPGTVVAKALGKLIDVGVVAAIDGQLTLVGGVFQHAARAALARPSGGEHDALPAEARKVMHAFVVDGRLQSIPTAHSKRLIVLDWLAQAFEPGARYSEQMVNLILGQRHPDTAALRRYLVDDGFLDRAGGQYWRAGGTVVEPSGNT